MKLIENPFAGYGRAVTGKQFVGRATYIQSIENRVTQSSDPNNLAIIGYPRIGKSSLVKQAIMEISAQLVADKKIPIWINFGTLDESASFFQTLVIKAYEKLEKNFQKGKIIKGIYENVQKPTLTWISLKSEVERFFEKTTEKGYLFIFILDEFDSARMLFKDKYHAFQELRDLGYRGTFKITFVTTSRRSLKEIELKCSANSVLDLIFKKEYLSLYPAEEMVKYYQLYENVGIQLTSEHKKDIEYYCGGHPYLLAVLGFEIVETYKKQEVILVPVIFKKLRLDFENYYDQLIDLLKEDKTYDKILQILFGPILTVTNSDINELTAVYGLLKEVPLPNDDKGLTTFSPHFTQYLSKLGRKVDFWPLWTSLEVKLREMITTVLKKKAGDNWFELIRTRFPSQSEKALVMRSEAKEDEKNENLLYYFDSKPLFEIIQHNKCWNDFKTIFGSDREKPNLEKKMNLIIKIRNPYAHSRFDSIDPDTILQAEMFCKEILKQLDTYLAS